MNTAPSLWTQIFRRLQRDARAGELRLLGLSVLLAVAAVAAVALLGDRLERALRRDAAQLIGGDLVVVADRPAAEPWRERVKALGLQQSHTASFPSMVRAPVDQGGGARLVAVKVVDAAYPLRGQVALRAAANPGGGPKPGEVWVDQAVLDSLGLRLGDRLGVGESWLPVRAVIQTEPDRGAGFLAFAPRVMLHEADLEATQLVQPASRVSYRMAVAGDARQASALRVLELELREHLKGGQWRGARVETLSTGRPELRQTLERGERFLSLVALLAALLSGIAVALAARDFAARHVDECAMLRVLGQKGRRVALLYAGEFLAAGALASVLGLVLGYALHGVLLAILGDWVTVELPPPGWQPFALGLGLGLSLLIAFGLPPVLGLARVPPLRVLRRDAAARGGAAWLAIWVGGLGCTALLTMVARDPVLGLVTLLGFAVAAALLVLLAWLGLKGLARAVRGTGSWALAVRQLGSRPGLAAAQAAALGLGLLALALLALVRTDLMDSWRLATPDRGPDRFAINVLPEQGEAFRQQLVNAGSPPLDWHPMFRGRLEAINGQSVAQRKFATARAERLVEREFNLSHAAAMPGHNQEVSGAWNADSGGLSVEQGLAEELGLHLGDRLGFDVAGAPMEGAITQIRAVDWASMRTNFFVMVQRAEMPEVHSTWIATYRAPKGPRAALLDRQLSATFPNVTLVDVSEQIAQLQRVLGQVGQAVELLFGFALAAGLVVLVGALTATREARLREAAVWRALGAGSALLARVQRAELLMLGMLAGGLAGALALGLGAVLASQVFQFAWQPKPWVPLGTLVGGALLAWAAGWWGLRGVLRRPVVQTLREAVAE